MNEQASELNDKLKEANPALLDMLSKKGKEIFFPKRGVLQQTADAKGKDINATIGIALEEDGSPMRLKSISSNVKLGPKDIFPYAPGFGSPDLREIWKESLFTKNPSLKGKEISNPVATSGLTQGLFVSGYLFVDPKDKIIMPDIYWENYNLIFKNGYGAEFDSFPFFSGNGFNLKGFEEAISKSNGKKIVFFNFPNNPVGYTVSESEAGKITDIIKNRAEKGDKIVVIVDDAYFGLVYEDGIYKESLFSNLADLHENVLAVKVDGPTKESYVWGLRVGFITYGIKNGNQKIYSALEAKSGGIVRGSVSMCSNLSQSLIVDAIKSSDYDEDKREKYDILKKRYEIVKEIFGSHKEYSEYFEPLPFNSGYFMCVKLKNLDAEKVRKILLDNYSTGVIAIENLLRVTFSAIPSDKISKIFDNIYNACKEA